MLALTSIQFESIIRDYYGKKVDNSVKLEAVNCHDSYSGHYSIDAKDKFLDNDSFKHIQFPTLRKQRDPHRPTSLYPTFKGLTSHLKSINKGELAPGPELLYPGLLAERKYHRLDFKNDTKDHLWNLETTVKAVTCFSETPRHNHNQFSRDQVRDEGPRVELVVVAWLQEVKQSFSFSASVATDGDLRTLQKGLRSHLEKAAPFIKTTFWYRRDSKVEGYLEQYPVFVAIAGGKDPVLGDTVNWQELESLSLEGFADVVWDCLLKEKSLVTMIMSRDHLDCKKEKSQKLKKEKNEELKKLEEKIHYENEFKKRDDLVSCDRRKTMLVTFA